MEDTKRNQLSGVPTLNINHMENMFTVKDDGDGVLYYDLSDTLFMNIDNLPPSNYEVHDVKSTDTLFRLAHKYYGNSNLWWVIAVANNIDDPFDLPKTVKILDSRSVSMILTTIDE